MDFIDQLKQFSSRVEKLKNQIFTEEATKTSIIMPFFQMLGYDVFNPDEFIPEFTADVGIKKGEKVDYAIKIDGEPVILIEAKSINENLSKHDSQLFRYFGTSNAKFAILTNGIIYRFYTDLDEQNKMDEKPFLEINILDIKENNVNELKKFSKDNFDINKIFNTAEELKYSNEIKLLLSSNLTNPNENFITYILSEIYSGKRTQRVIEKFTPVIKKSFNQFITETMNEKIKNALNNEVTDDTPSGEEVAVTEEINETKNKIETTIDELEGYAIIKSLLNDTIDINRLSYKDTESYFGILVDNNVRKWICRLKLDSFQKYLFIHNDVNEKFAIDSINDLYNHKDLIIDICNKYI